MPDGSWKREGEPEMMVYQDSAQLNFPKEKMVSCNADHSHIAKLRRGESGAYPDIKRTIKQALLRVVEEQANAGLSSLQLQSGVKAVVEERSRPNRDYIKGSGPERTPVPAGKSLSQSQGSSISEPQEKTADVLHAKDVVSAHSPPASDGRENGFIVQNKQAISDPTITPPSAQIMSRDDEEVPKGDTKASEPSMQRETDASSDRSNPPSSPMEQESADRAMGRVTDPTLRQDLCSASQEGDVEKVRSLLAQGCSIHESSADLVHHERDAFLLAARSGRLDVLKLLLEHNCDVSKRTLRSNTALHLISFDPEIKPEPVIKSLVVLLLEHGVPLEARGTVGITALISSACNGKISIAGCLLDHGADIHPADDDGYTALHWAAKKGYHDIVVLLISKGADIHCTDKYLYTALHWAAKNGYHRIVALLISKGADIHSTDKHLYTALHWAAKNGYHRIVALLISKGADIHSTDKDGYTALHSAAEQDHHEVVALLISKGARLETRTKGYSETPLHSSCFAGNGTGKSTKLLLHAGADKEAISGAPSRRALHIAARNGNLEVLNELLAFGVEIDAAADDDLCALHYARHWGHWRILEALLAKGADPFLLNKSGNRPSKSIWHPSAKISPWDKEKCQKLLKDAEKAWKEKQRREKNDPGKGQSARPLGRRST